MKRTHKVVTTKQSLLTRVTIEKNVSIPDEPILPRTTITLEMKEVTYNTVNEQL